jgi:hypothetical protein
MKVGHSYGDPSRPLITEAETIPSNGLAKQVFLEPSTLLGRHCEPKAKQSTGADLDRFVPRDNGHLCVCTRKFAW